MARVILSVLALLLSIGVLVAGNGLLGTCA